MNVNEFTKIILYKRQTKLEILSLFARLCHPAIENIMEMKATVNKDRPFQDSAVQALKEENVRRMFKIEENPKKPKDINQTMPKTL